LKNIAWNITQTFLHEMITDLIGYDNYTFLFLYPDTRGGGGQTNKTAAMTAIGNTNHFGIAHIGFPTKEVAQKAINELHGLEVNGKVLFAEYLNPYNIRYVKRKLGFPEMSMMTKTSASRQYQQQSRQDQQQQQRPRVPFSEFSRRMPTNNNQPSFPPRPMNPQNNHNNINHDNINNNHHNDNIPPQQPEQQQQQLEQEQQKAEETAPVEPQQSERIAEPDQVEESQPTTSAPVGHQESVAFFHDSEPSPIFPREDITEETMTPPPLQHLQESFAEDPDHHDDYHHEESNYSTDDDSHHDHITSE
jgi:RNA recognition motif-containing protein